MGTRWCPGGIAPPSLPPLRHPPAPGPGGCGSPPGPGGAHRDPGTPRGPAPPLAAAAKGAFWRGRGAGGPAGGGDLAAPPPPRRGGPAGPGVAPVARWPGAARPVPIDFPLWSFATKGRIQTVPRFVQSARRASARRRLAPWRSALPNQPPTLTSNQRPGARPIGGEEPEHGLCVS